MPQIGAAPFEYKPAGLPWGGMTTLSKSAPGQFELLENCYVSRDGQEIRMFPGFKCVLDPVTQEGAASGYSVLINEALRPVLDGSPRENLQELVPTEQLQSYAAPTHWHAFERVRDRWIIAGETDFRKTPIFDGALAIELTISEFDDSGGDTVLTLSDDYTTGLHGPFVGAWVWIEGLVGADANLLNDLAHRVTALPGTDQITLETAISAAAARTGETGSVWLVTKPRTDPTLATGATETGDRQSLTIWTAVDSLSPDLATPTSTVHAAFVANRMRDFGDVVGNSIEGTIGTGGNESRREQRSLPYRLVPVATTDRLIMVAPGYGCVFQAPVTVPIDFVPPTIGVSASPGTSVGVGWTGNDVYDMPRCVGVPKAVMWEDHDLVPDSSQHIIADNNLPDASAFGGSSTEGSPPINLRNGTYKFRIAYEDTITGEQGLLSDEIVLTTDNRTFKQHIVLFPYFPGYLLHESLALRINVYRTERNGAAYYYSHSLGPETFGTTRLITGAQSAKYGLDPTLAVTTGEFMHHVRHLVPFAEDFELRQRRPLAIIPLIEQMPYGAKCFRMIRGWPIYGGALGNAGKRLELFRGTMSTARDNVHYRRSDETFSQSYLLSSLNGISHYGADTGFGCAGRNLPAAYFQQRIISQTLFDYPTQVQGVASYTNTRTDNTAGSIEAKYIRYRLFDTPLTPFETFSARSAEDAYLQLPRGRLQIGEQDHPGVVPATSTIQVSTERDGDIEGIGSTAGQAVVATRMRTYFLGWSQSPVGGNPEIAADQFGCISANSMVEFDGGCAWLSDRGPCAMMGSGFVFIGAPLERYFQGETSVYLRDSQGMMRHSWSCHDPERGLVYFGLFADRGQGSVTVTYQGTEYDWDAASDEAKSRFPCDEVLIWSYASNAWSLFRPPPGSEILWMTSGEDSNGDSRVLMLLRDGRIYALDDTYNQFNKEVVSANITAASSGTTITHTTNAFAADKASYGTANNHIRVGMNAVVTDSEDNVVGTSRVASFTASTVTLEDAITVAASGMLLSVGNRVMTVKTNYLNPRGSMETSKSGNIHIRYTNWSRFAHLTLTGDTARDGTSPPPQALYANCQVVTSRKVKTVDGQATSTRMIVSKRDSVDDYVFLGVGETEDVVQDRGFTHGSTQGQNHRIELQIVGGAQFRLHQMLLEAQ